MDFSTSDLELAFPLFEFEGLLHHLAGVYDDLFLSLCLVSDLLARKS